VTAYLITVRAIVVYPILLGNDIVLNKYKPAIIYCFVFVSL